MTSLRTLLSAHAPLLLIDAASATVQAGFFESDGQVRWQFSQEEAGVGVFGCIKALGVDPELVRAFAFCEGPGSVLGVRSVAMALRVWQALAPRPIFAYGSLAIVSHAIGQSDVGVIADARRDRWHHYSLNEGLGLRATGELSGNLVLPDGFRHWSALPANVQRVPYLLGELLPRIPDAALFHETDAPDAYLAAEPSYATWTPHIHRAPMTTT